jgi:hypothetical protein
VALEGPRRVVGDRARHCAERARAAAVFVVLALEPPRLGSEPPPAPPAVAQREDDEPNPLLARAATGPAKAVTLALEAGGVAAVTPASGGLAAGGGALRVLAGGGRFGGSAGVAGLSPVSLDLAPGRVRLVRVPLDLAGYAVVRGARIDLRGEAGMVLAALHIAGEGYAPNLSATRLEVGLRGAVIGRWWLGRRHALWAGLDVTGTPRPYDFTVAGRPIRGSSPALWLRLAAGLAVRLD